MREDHVRAWACDRVIVAGASHDHAVRRASTAVERIVAAIAHQHVVARATAQHIAACMARQHVVQQIAREIRLRAAAAVHDRLLDIRRQRVGAAIGQTHMHQIVALTRRLHHGVARRVDVVHVIAQTTDQTITAQPAIQRVVARTAGQRVGRRIAHQPVVERIADDSHASGRDHAPVFDVVGQCVAAGSEPHLHQIVPFVRHLDDLVERRIHFIDVIAETADQGVLARAADQRVIAVQSRDDVVTRQPVEALVARRAFQRVAIGTGRVAQQLRHAHAAVVEANLLHVPHRHRRTIA